MISSTRFERKGSSSGRWFVADHFWYSCLLGLLASVTDGLSTCVQESLVISRRGFRGTDLNKETLTAENGH